MKFLPKFLMLYNKFNLIILKTECLFLNFYGKLCLHLVKFILKQIGSLRRSKFLWYFCFIWVTNVSFWVNMQEWVTVPDQLISLSTEVTIGTYLIQYCFEKGFYEQIARFFRTYPCPPADISDRTCYFTVVVAILDFGRGRMKYKGF